MRGPFLTGALLLAGCGLLDTAPQEPLPDPGKSAFSQAQALEVCLGKTRIDGRAEGVSRGLCVADGTVERACSGDAGCARGERCLCGRCALDSCREGAPCDGGRICREGLCVVPCQDASVCAPGEVCSGGGCATPCQGNAACGYGGRCDLLSGVCRAEGCEPGASCGAGRSCVEIERAIELREPSWSGASTLLLEARERQGGARRSSIRRATLGQDGRLRVEEAALLPPETDARAPAPLLVGGALRWIYMETPDGRIERRPVNDGEAGEPELVLAPQEPWEQGRVGSPSVIEYRGNTLLFYEAGEGAALGVARLGGASPERRLLLRPGDLERPGRWEKMERVGAPDAVESAGLLLVYFSARGVEGGPAQQGAQVFPAESNDSIGLLASDDGSHFDAAAGPVIARQSNLRTYLGERESSVSFEKGATTMIFVAADAAGETAGLGLLRSR